VYRSWVLSAAALASLGLPLAACGNGEEQVVEEECFSNRDYFNKKVWKPVLEQKCFSCHNQSGVAAYTSLVLQPSAQTGHIDANLEAFTKAARYEVDGESIILQKPLGKLEHEGGGVLQADSEEFEVITAMLARLDAPVTCDDELEVDDHFTPINPDSVEPGQIELLTPQQTLRKVTLAFGGRLPSANELAALEEGGLEATLPGVIEDLSQTEIFHERVREIFNDLFLTDKYLGGREAIDLLDRDIFPDAYWHIDDQDNPKDYSGVDPVFLENAREYTNDSVAREPLMLLKHIVDNDLPMTDLIAADYMMFNPFSARVYGVTDIDFSNPNDPNEWKPGQIPGQPHAGLLTSAMFLNRFPTTPTNRNRHRSRMVYSFFLATDVMALAERPLDPTSITDFNPTLYNPQCTSCHGVIDPLAGTFQNWNDRGMYEPPEAWFQEMRPPGFGEQSVPQGMNTESIVWAAERLAADPRFATAMTINVYKGMTGHEPLNPLSEDPSEYENLLIGYEVQQKFFEETSASFIDSGFNLKHLIVAIAKSPYYRLTNLSAETDDLTKLQYAGIGTGRLLTPEMLHRKVEAVFGVPWREGDRDQLLSTRAYRILYGGTDSDDVTQRITAVNGIMANVQWRMANAMACRVTARDLALPKDNRRLFKFVEQSFQPLDDNGFEVAGAVAAIKSNIQFLHKHILGEQIAIDDPEIEATYQLFFETWEESKAGVASEELSRFLPGACRGERDLITDEELPEDQRIREDREGTVRAWMAVVTYLLADQRFLHE
jgi:hypothetical protein